MKVYLFHGGGLVGMLNKISQIKKEFDPLSISEFYSKDNYWNQVKLDLLSSSLFSEKRLVILEDFNDISFDGIDSDQLTVILKFSKTLPVNSAILKVLPKGSQIINFPEDKEESIFPLLDLLAEKNPKALIELDKSLKVYGGQYILTMIFYMLRRFILPIGNLPSFVQKKLQSQKRDFPLERIKFFYKDVIETDFKIKQGLLEEKLGLHLLVEKFLR